MVDVGAIANFLDLANPRTRLDAFPMFVIAKDVIRVLLRDKLAYSYSQCEARCTAAVQYWRQNHAFLKLDMPRSW